MTNGNGSGTQNLSAYDAAGAGGKGGNANNKGVGGQENEKLRTSGGAGNPGGTGLSSGVKGDDGTGGLLIIYARELKNNSGASITADGSNGGNTSSNALSASGGSSGGGSINIYYKNTYSNSGTLQANGGPRLGHKDHKKSGAGGAGCIADPLKVSF